MSAINSTFVSCLIAMLLFPYLRLEQTFFSFTAQDPPILVDYCELITNPTRYDEKVIATEAIELINITPVLDGGEPFLYSPECDKSSLTRVLIDIYESSLDSTSDTYKEIEKMILKAKENNRQQAIRVKVLIIGRFFGPKSKGGYGHLDWARCKLVVSKIEKVDLIPEETPWPLGYERRN